MGETSFYAFDVYNFAGKGLISTKKSFQTETLIPKLLVIQEKNIV